MLFANQKRYTLDVVSQVQQTNHRRCAHAATTATSSGWRSRGMLSGATWAGCRRTDGIVGESMVDPGGVSADVGI
jgi:hypothetical protein